MKLQKRSCKECGRPVYIDDFGEPIHYETNQYKCHPYDNDSPVAR